MHAFILMFCRVPHFFANPDSLLFQGANIESYFTALFPARHFSTVARRKQLSSDQEK